jgi:rhodanese-related sulfurtransferase
MKLIIAIIFALFALPATAEVTNIDNAELQKLLDSGVPIIDIRRPEEWLETGIVPGSHMITFFDQRGDYDLHGWLAQLNKIAGKDEPFILICRTGNRTETVSDFLDGEMDYSKIHNVTDGITKWIEQGNKTVKP